MIEIVLLLVIVCLLGLITFLVVNEKQRSNAEAARLCLLADSAMSYLKSKTLEEKAYLDLQKKEYDSRVAYLHDMMAKEEHKKREESKPASKMLVTTEDGRIEEIDASDLEVLGT